MGGEVTRDGTGCKIAQSAPEQDGRAKQMAESRIFEMKSDGTLEIPEHIRKAKGWKEGQRFAVVPVGEGSAIVPVPRREDLFGSMEGANPEGYRDRNDRY